MISDYIHETDNAYLENMHREGMGEKKLIHLDLNNKLILDIGSGLGFFLRSIYEELPEDCLYIAVDRDFNKLLFLKDVLARKIREEIFSLSVRIFKHPYSKSVSRYCN